MVIRTVRNLVLLTALALGATVVPIGTASAAGTVGRQAPPPSSLCGLEDLGGDPLTLEVLQGACASARAAAGAVESEAGSFALRPVSVTEAVLYNDCTLGLLPGPCDRYL
ncbi:hypothetical protein KDK95_32160 [Actinospica sp. MGRD01-02]|uniref:Uncharacterized protein n=1 Tax=Actinospica acidithermotolerans TaxID=2828514 RepID=A0A941EIF4_9ACTN|nr:hypothetical protein [Actinospica acidithermotolerans]MBR7831003.1 hypothetical protein [Actinospica acidithermotolerans]